MREAQNHRQDLTTLSESLTIGQVAHLTAMSTKTIRYYESIGVLPHPPRDVNRYRRYGRDDIDRLLLLRRLRLLGVSLSAAKSLLRGASEARSTEAIQELVTLVDERLTTLDQERTELQLLQAEVEGW